MVEVIYGCDESTIRNAAKKYAEQLGPHYFMLTNVGRIILIVIVSS